MSNRCSLIEQVGMIFLYGLACYIRDSKLGSPAKETPDKCERSTNYSTEYEGSSIRRQLIKPSKDGYGSNDSYYENSSPNQDRLCCPSCGFSLGFNVGLYKVRNLSDSFLNIGRSQEFVYCRRLSKFTHFFFGVIDRLFRVIHITYKFSLDYTKIQENPLNIW